VAKKARIAQKRSKPRKVCALEVEMDLESLHRVISSHAEALAELAAIIDTWRTALKKSSKIK
jgi:hypothetical protein